MPLQCHSCGASLTGQEPTCPRCGAPRPVSPAQPAPGPAVLVFAPPQQPAPRRKTSPWLIAGCSLWVMIVGGGIVVALLAGFGVFNPKGDNALPNTTGPGWWKATAPGLGSFEFKLNPSQSAITEFAFQIPKITCPDITYSTTFVEVQKSPPWSVQKRQFDADVLIENDQNTGLMVDVEVSGAIASAGQQASGTWVFDGEVGTSCQGSWTGIPSK